MSNAETTTASRLAAIESELDKATAQIEKLNAQLAKCRAHIAPLQREKMDLSMVEIERVVRVKKAAGEWDGLKPKLEHILNG
jgi:predicted  nucleic acid-binding Zn-ribbon protein